MSRFNLMKFAQRPYGACTARVAEHVLNPPFLHVTSGSQAGLDICTLANKSYIKAGL